MITKENLMQMQRGNYFYAFCPSRYSENDNYSMNIRLLHAIYEILDDYMISKSTHGYTYIMDAVCIIIDLRTLDVCLIKDVYPLIAIKHRIRDISSIEHDIRNSINAAFRASESGCSGNTGLLKYYSKKPGNKTLLLDTVQKVGEKLIRESE